MADQRRIGPELTLRQLQPMVELELEPVPNLPVPPARQCTLWQTAEEAPRAFLTRMPGLGATPGAGGGACSSSGGEECSHFLV